MATSSVALWQDTIDALILMIEEFGQPMELQSRSTRSPNMGGTKFRLDFEKDFDFVGAIDTDRKGKIVFDGTNEERLISYSIYLEYRPNVTSEKWVLFNNKRVDIILVENIGELNGILRLDCSERGTTANESNKA